MTYEATALSIAKEVLKPSSGIIDALLTPKIKRLREWAAGRDLRARIDQDKLEDAFLAYMRRLLSRVSGVTTLVFPQQVLALPAIYESLKLEVRPLNAGMTLETNTPPAKGRLTRTQNQVTEISITRPGRRTYIVDSAGMGKSTFARHLIMREIVDSDRIPIFLELRRIGEGTSLFEALARDLDELHRVFDREAFLSLLARGRFLLVLDGLDEVSSATLPSLCQQIEELSTKAEESAIILTSRPEAPLPTMAGAQLLTFAPLSIEQAQSLVRRYDAVGQIDVGARLIRRFDTLPQQFLTTPLLVALSYRSFGYNGEVSSKVTSFYDELYSALYKGHDLTKAGFSRKKESGLDVDAFRRLLRGFAFLLAIQQKNSLSNSTAALKTIDDSIRLTGTHPTSSAAFLEDLLLAVPLLVRDGPELRFAHRTIEEFFAAEYIAFAQDGFEIAQEICRMQEGDRFSQMMSFLKDISPSLFKKAVAAPIARDFLAYCPDIKRDSVRTLAFLAPDSYLSIRRVGEKSDKSSRPDARSIYISFRISLRSSESFFVDAILTGPLRPLIRIAASYLAEYKERFEEDLRFEELGDLLLGKWLHSSDPRLHDGSIGTEFEVVAMALTTLLLDLSDNFLQEQTWLSFSEQRARKLLSEVEEEERATAMVRAFLRS